MVLVFKIAWATLRKRSKSMIFAKETAFSKRIISKKPPAAGYTPSNDQFILRASTAYSSIFSNLQAAFVHKTFLQTGWREILLQPVSLLQNLH